MANKKETEYMGTLVCDVVRGDIVMAEGSLNAHEKMEFVKDTLMQC